MKTNKFIKSVVRVVFVTAAILCAVFVTLVLFTAHAKLSPETVAVVDQLEQNFRIVTGSELLSKLTLNHDQKQESAVTCEKINPISRYVVSQAKIGNEVIGDVEFDLRTSWFTSVGKATVRPIRVNIPKFKNGSAEFVGAIKGEQEALAQVDDKSVRLALVSIGFTVSMRDEIYDLREACSK